MAQRWLPRPGDPVGPKEPVGRRLFDEPALVGATDQKPTGLLDYRHFEERRIPVEVSFDRLGPDNVDRKVLAFLAPIARCHGDARKPRKKFGGWIWLKSDQLTKPPKGANFPITASPIQAENPQHIEHNPYHGHTACAADHHSVALHLQYLFSTYGKLRECRDPKDKAPISNRVGHAARYFIGLFRQMSGRK